MRAEDAGKKRNAEMRKEKPYRLLGGSGIGENEKRERETNE